MRFRFLAVFALLLPLLANAASLEAGGNHNCALTDMGGVQCWGANGSGQLGDGTVVDRLTPVAVSGLSSGVLSIAMGEMHSCGLTAVGGVQCWGRNNYGQLGDGTTIDRLTPVAVTGLSSGVQIIVAGAYFTCALMTAGDIRCWGINNFGQLGDGTITDRLTPVELSGLDSIQAIAAGSYHSCALTNAGGVVCWGNNARGQLGDGTATNRLTPVAVSGLGSGVQMIASIARHSCALTTAGALQCWGNNSKGQLGDGTTTNRLTPVAVSGLSNDVQAITGGGDHSCALTNGGGVQCWGDNARGQLGDGTTTDRLTPVGVSGLSSGVQAVTAGNVHSCALTNAGGVQCWGWNLQGQLGDGTTTAKLLPVSVVEPDGDNDGVPDIWDAFPLDNNESVDTDSDGLGDNADVDDDNDGVDDWDDNCSFVSNPDQLDADSDGIGNACDTTPNGDTDNDGIDNLTDNCVSISNTNQLNTDGDAQGDVCDNDDDNDGVVDVLVISAISAGVNHACALGNTGVHCWGRNDYGQASVPTLVNPVAVSAGGIHTCALDNTGVHCWGDNTYGQTTVPALLNPVAVSAGNLYTCALDSTGVHCWGYNVFGEATVPALVNPVAVSAGVFNTCALDDTGVHCWGHNMYGQTTVPTLVNPVAVSSAESFFICALDSIGVHCWGDASNGGVTSVPALISPVAVSAGVSHACALDATGVHCWGSNNFGESTVPTLENTVAISAGSNYTCGLDNTGVHCWGDNTYGQTTVPLVALDNCRLIPNLDQQDTDGDAQGDVCDNDDDNDGVADVSDAFPLDATESVDTDSDGIGDNADTTPNGDTDNDGIDNAADNCPLIANSNQLDYDANNIGDACDDPVPVPEDVAGVMKNAKAGSAVAFAGDVNGDGYGDYVVGMPGYDIPAAPPVKIIKDAGRAEVISGKTGTVLMSVNGVAAKDAMGFAVAGNGDIDNDGFDDVVVGAPTADDTESGIKDTGSAILLYGPNGERRQTFFGTEPKSQFGYAVSVTDANNDGHADILIGAPKDSDIWPYAKKVGSVSLFSGENNSLLVKWYGGASGWGFGSSVLLADLDADGVAEIIVGSPYATHATSSGSSDGTGFVMASTASGWRGEYPRAGKVSVYGLAEGYRLWSTGIYKKNALFGSSLAVADVNADGENELIVGAPGYAGINYEGNKATGSVSVISGDVGFEMGRFFGESKKTGFGLVVSAGDVNGDGYDDIIAGTKLDDNSGAKVIKDTGSVSVWSGNDYSLITTLYGEKKGDLFGAAVSAGDINSDGKADLIIGIPGFDALPILPATKPMKDTGAVRVLSGGDL